MYRERTVNGKTSQELILCLSQTAIYFSICSLEPKVRILSKHVRDHWKIENQMHWSLDVILQKIQAGFLRGRERRIQRSSADQY